jgi:tripartite-type tricarboxylate transporter receptor subunit TctC
LFADAQRNLMYAQATAETAASKAGDRMNTNRRCLIKTLLAFSVSSNFCGLATAQSYPTRPIKLVVPFPSGGTIDIVGRLVAQYMAPLLNQTVIVDNRPGAGATIALKAVAAADPDGYTLLIGSTGSLAINPALYKSVDYTQIKNLVPVATVASTPNLLAVASSVPATTVAELIALAKANPGKLSHGASLGTPPHLLGEFFRAKTGTDIVYVPYRGTAMAIPDLLAGRTQITAESIAALLPYIQQGTIRPIVVASGERLPELPNVPTLIESGLDGYPTETWTGLVAPPATPTTIVNILNAAVNRALSSPAAQASLAKLGFRAKLESPQDFAALIATDASKWADVVALTGAKVD